MKNSEKITVGRLLITLFMVVIVIIGGTFAWLTYSSGKSALVLSIGDINDTKIILKPYQVRETLTPVNTYTSGVYSEVETVNNGSSSTSISLYYKINDLNQDLASGGLKYTITSSTSKDGTYEEVKTGDFSHVGVDDEKVVILETKIDPSSKVYYRVYLWLDSNVGNQTALQNTNLDVELNGTITQEATKPQLVDGMIPVIIENDGTVTTISSDSKDWYDYGNQKWANIVLVNNNSRNTYEGTTGKTVATTDILAYYVWIPRYRYKIWTTGMSSVNSEKSVNIVFESVDDPMTLGTKSGEYRTHPAFWFDGDNDGVVDGGETLAGIWVGKFETTGSATTPTVLPNVSSLTNQNISSQFATSLLFSNGTFNSSTGKVAFSDASNGVNITDSTYGLAINADSHMMKNSEWGAVTYLSHSQYGINKDVRINNYYNSNYKTGCGASSVDGAASTTCEITYGSGLENYPQSTTGNITGVFDMSGSANEYVMGNYESNVGNSGFTVLPDSKYYDLYTATESTTACSGGVCYGHALSETSSWYSDTSQFVSASAPWLLRGGDYSLGSSAGIFYVSESSGNTSSGFRLTLITLPTYTVSYNLNTGTGTLDDQIKVYGVDLTLSSTVPEKANYTFKGWNTKSDGNGTTYSSGATYTANANTTLYAIWSANTYAISYTLTGGTSGTNAPTSGKFDSVVTISNPTKTVTVTGNANGTGATVGSATSKAQTFAGWTASNLNTSTAYYGTSSSSVTTSWSNASTKVTAQYFKNLASSGNTVTLTANWTAVSFNLPTVTKSGYTCTWNTASDGSGTSYESGASYTPSTTSEAEITLYAFCTSSNGYAIAYTLNGGTKGTNAPTSGTTNNVVTISNPTKTVTVTGNANGTGATVGSATSGSQTFAGWTANNLNTSTAKYGMYSSYMVTSSWTNGSTKVKAQYFKNLASNGEIVTLIANWTAVSFNLPTVTKSGYTCTWNTASNGSGTSYESGASYTPSETSEAEITLYAVCTASSTSGSYTISYTLNGGTAGTNAPTSGAIDSVVTISNPTKTVTVTGNANGTGATVGNATSKAQTFAGWTASGLNTSTAKYGTSSSSVTTSWSNGSTKVTAQYFKNLASSGNTVTLTANWTAVSFDLPTVTKTGYTCTWNTASNGSGTSYDSGASYTPSTTSESSITLYAVCTAITYTVSYDANGGSGAPSSQTKTYGETLTLSSTKPTKSGYTFLGWSTSSTATSATYEAGGSYTANADATLYAVWSSSSTTNGYTIAYTLNGGTKGTNAPTSATIDSVVTISNPTKTVTVTGNANGTGATVGSATSGSQTFAGWTASNLNTSTAKYGSYSSWVSSSWTNGSTKVKAQYFKNLASNGEIVTLIANWTAVSFNLPTVTKSGYTCTWNTASNGSGTSYESGASYTPSETSEAEITLYAVCTASSTSGSYTIAYTLNGGTKGTNAPTSGTIDSVVTISNPTKTVKVTGNANGTGATVGSATSGAQTFAGWTASNLNTSTAYYGTSSSSVTTSWSNGSTKVKAQYFKNLASSGNTVTLTANWTAVSFDLPTVTKTGYTCTWNTASNGRGTSYASGASYTPSTTGSASVTLYAVCASDSYTISYTLNGGTSGTNAPTSGTIDSVVTISNPTKTVTVTGNANGTGATVGNATSKAQTFAGWTASNLNTSTAKYGTSSSSVTTSWSNGSTKVTAQYFKNLASSGNTVTLTANWTAVSFNLPTVEKTGYTCTWNTASNGSGTSYDSGASYTPSTTGSASVTLYAVCTANTYTVSYNANGGSGAPSSQTKTYGETLTLSSTKPTRSGYTFLGWSTSSTATSATYEAGGSYTANANATLYAVWQASSLIQSYSCANTSKGSSPYNFTYTGNCKVVDDGSNNWRIKFLTSGTFKASASVQIDVFLVGGGGGGGDGYTWWNKYGDKNMGGGGGGGGGGYGNTSLAVSVKSGTSYTITIGAGGASGEDGDTTTAFGVSAAGGSAGGIGLANDSYPNGGGGSAGKGGNNGGKGGGDTDEGGATAGSSCSVSTREFGSSSGTCYAGGGGGGANYNGYVGEGTAGAAGSGGGGKGNGGSATANTGGGGGGGKAPSSAGTGSGGSGASGIVIIRNKR